MKLIPPCTAFVQLLLLVLSFSADQNLVGKARSCWKFSVSLEVCWRTTLYVMSFRAGRDHLHFIYCHCRQRAVGQEDAVGLAGGCAGRCHCPGHQDMVTSLTWQSALGLGTRVTQELNQSHTSFAKVSRIFILLSHIWFVSLSEMPSCCRWPMRRPGVVAIPSGTSAGSCC